MKYFKRKLYNFLDSYLAFSERVWDKANSHGIQFGLNSFIEKPRIVNGPNYISLGVNSSIGHSSWLGAFESYGDQKFSPKIVIEDEVRIGNYACVTAIDSIVIKNGVLMSEYVYISDHFHGVDASVPESPKHQPLFSKGPVIIGENSFIGYRVSILSGVELGKHCVVGAHSVVTKSFPDYSMIAGAPAKVIKRFNFNEKCWR